MNIKELTRISSVGQISKDLYPNLLKSIVVRLGEEFIEMFGDFADTSNRSIRSYQLNDDIIDPMRKLIIGDIKIVNSEQRSGIGLIMLSSSLIGVFHFQHHEITSYTDFTAEILEAQKEHIASALVKAHYHTFSMNRSGLTMDSDISDVFPWAYEFNSVHGN